jgi:transposase, IS5 family
MKVERDPQMTIMNYDLDKIVRDDHPLKKIDLIISFKKLSLEFKELELGCGRNGYGVETGIRTLFLQFYYDLSDREMEDRLRYDVSFRWFCGFTLDDETPDHSYFCRIRKVLGTERVAKIFRKINKKAEAKGILRRVFTFVDSSAIISKETTWEQRDKALKDGEEALNNKNVSKYSADKDARFGCKGKKKFWFGFKKHQSMDMCSYLIKKVAVTPANVTDSKGVKHICPSEGMVFADKGYCVKEAQFEFRKRGCHSGAILKNNMKGKNRDKDKWITSLRAPYECAFSKDEKRARYRGQVKVQMQAFLDAIVHNVKRLVKLDSPPLFVGA